MQVISNSVNKVRIKFAGTGVGPLELFDVIVSGVSKEGFLFVLGKKSWDLTSGQNHVNKLEELFFLDF